MPSIINYRENQMKIGIVGFAGSGKTTIFNALTGLRAETGASGKTRENMGVIKVPDERVEHLARLHSSRKKTFAEVNFVDVGARPDGAAAKGSGLDSQVIQAMQNCEALVVVVRAFENPMLSSAPDPVRDLRDFRTELILSDLGPLENRLKRIQKEAGKDSERALLARCIAHLENEQPLATMDLAEEELRSLAGFAHLSRKPQLILVNQSESDLSGGIPEGLRQVAGEGTLLAISGKVEMDIAEMDEAEQPEFLEALGLTESARDRFVRSAFELLDLICFLTTGEDESRAWPIHRGTSAHRAAGKIHSDIERGFIRAEVISYEDLVSLGGEKQARDAGRLRLEGKEYIVRDGDVINFRFNV